MNINYNTVEDGPENVYTIFPLGEKVTAKKLADWLKAVAEYHGREDLVLTVHDGELRAKLSVDPNKKKPTNRVVSY